MANITAQTQLFAESLPEGHPLRGKVANLLKEARIQDDLFARATVLEGALNMRPGSLSKRPVAALPDIQQNFPDINPQFFDMRRDYDLYGAVIGGAGQIKGTAYTSDEIAQALISGLTIVNMDEVSGGSIYRRLGKKLANALKAGRVDMKGLAGTLRSWAKSRAMDVIDSRRDVSIDEGFGDEGFDQASMIDRFYSDPGTSETALSISVVNKPGMLQTIDRAVRKELRGPGQEAVWDAVLNDPDLLNPSARGMGIDQQPLAEAISQMTGTEISRQVAGRTFRDKVLPAMERALANDEKLQQTLMKDRDIQQVFQDAMRLARTAAWRGWTEDMPVQVVTMKGTEVFPNLAAAQKKYRDLNPDRQGKQFTWALKGRVRGQTAIRFEDWAMNKMMSMSASSKSGRAMAGPWYATTSNRAGVTRFFLGKNKAAATRWLRGISRSSDEETQVSALFQPRASVDLAFASRSKGLDRKDKQLLFLARSVYDNWEVALRDFQQQGTTRSEDADFMEQYAKNLRMASLRERAIRLASENPELRRRLLPLLKHDQLQELLSKEQELLSKEGAEKAKTEEGAKKLHEEYMKGLKDPSKSTKKPEDFFEKGEGGEKKEEKPKKEEKDAPPHHAKVNKDLKTLESDWEKIDPKKAEGDMRAAWKAMFGAADRFDDRSDLAAISVADSVKDFAHEIGTPEDKHGDLDAMVKGLHSMAVVEGKGDAAKGYEKMGLGAGYDPLKGREQTPADEAEEKKHFDKRGADRTSLRTQAIKLAHENPELRASLLPLLKQGASTKTAAGSGAANAKYLDSLPSQKKSKILKHIAKHYGVSVREIEKELVDRDAEDLFEYAATDRAMAMEIYQDFKRLRLASEQEAEKFDAESEAAEDQSQADEAKAEAARVKEAAAKLKQAPQDTDFDIQF